MLKYITKMTVILGFYLFLTGSILASSLSVQIEQPKSPTNQNNFNIVFVALDISNNPITVKCFKKGPSDGSYSQFGSDINLSAGGNTDSCSVDSSIITSEGIYSFYVTANGTSSSTVSVDYRNSTPGTPGNYSKEKISSCDYKIKFRTSDDGGKTSRVKIYRSDQTSFNADSGTEIGTIIIGSNADGEFTNSVPDCNKTYYFALRAFDNAGNGSGTVGDSFTTTVVTSGSSKNTQTSENEKTQGAVSVSGSVLDVSAEATLGAQKSVLGEQSDSQNEPEDLYSSKSSSQWNYLIGFVALCVILFAYVARKNIIKFLRE